MFDELKRAIIEGDDQKALSLTKTHLKEGTAALDIMQKGLIPGMDVVGQRFRAYEMYLPEVIQCATAMKGAMDELKPHLAQSEDASLGKIVIATIEGDVHDIGKNLVSMMLEGAGFDVIDLGVDVSVDRIIESAREASADVIGLSALLTVTMIGLEPAIRKIKDNIEGMKVMVGGAPITKEFADKVGADGFAPDALRAINLAKSLIDEAS
jgi:5-methyltetrahydrofolate--homocysteine methyltransferase